MQHIFQMSAHLQSFANTIFEIVNTISVPKMWQEQLFATRLIFICYTLLFGVAYSFLLPSSLPSLSSLSPPFIYSLNHLAAEPQYLWDAVLGRGMAINTRRFTNNLCPGGILKREPRFSCKYLQLNFRNAQL